MTEPSEMGAGLGHSGPPPAATIEVTLRSGDTVVRRFVRSCPEDADQIRQMAQHASGWLQAWGCQLSTDQWHNDARAQRLEGAA